MTSDVVLMGDTPLVLTKAEAEFFRESGISDYVDDCCVVLGDIPAVNISEPEFQYVSDLLPIGKPGISASWSDRREFLERKK